MELNLATRLALFEALFASMIDDLDEEAQNRVFGKAIEHTTQEATKRGIASFFGHLMERKLKQSGDI